MRELFDYLMVAIIILSMGTTIITVFTLQDLQRERNEMLNEMLEERREIFEGLQKIHEQQVAAMIGYVQDYYPNENEVKNNGKN